MRMEATPLGAEPVGLALPRGAVSAHAHYSDHKKKSRDFSLSLFPTLPLFSSGRHAQKEAVLWLEV